MGLKNKEVKMKNLFNYLICLCCYLGSISVAYAQSELCKITLNITTANYNKYDARNKTLNLGCQFEESGSPNMVVPYCADEDTCNKLMQKSCVTYSLQLNSKSEWINHSYNRIKKKALQKNITLEVVDYNNENQRMRAVYVESEEHCTELIPPPAPASAEKTNV